MGWRSDWQTVLDAETARWSAMTCEQLTSELADVRCYQVEVGSRRCQVEVELLENTESYLHVIVAVDDGVLPRSISPLTQTFIRQKSAKPCSASA
jgi:hypothetical protein